MRIVHVTTFLHPERFGGAERIVRSLARAQAAAGHDVAIVTSSSASGASPETPATEDGVRVFRYALPPRARGARFLLAVRRGTKAALARLGPSPEGVLHAHQLASAAPALASPGGRRTVFSFYAPYAEERAAERGRTRAPLERLAQRGAAHLDRACLRSARVVHVLSRAAAAQAARLAPGVADRLRTVPPGVDRAFSPPSDGRRPGSAPDGEGGGGPVRLVTVRRLVRRMGLTDLLAAVARLRAAGTDVRLEVVGAGPEEERLRRLVVELHLEGAVRLAGALDDRALVERYRAADLFVLPSTSLEGFGMATLEALACGVPVVGTTVGATPELLRRWLPAAPCVPPGAETLAAGIGEALVRLPALRRDALAAAGAIAVDASWEAAADRMVRLYRAGGGSG
ncbi:MAG: glycosyltransferase family 4 protein [Planctomycetota bacterium JB042]